MKHPWDAYSVRLFRTANGEYTPECLTTDRARARAKAKQLAKRYVDRVEIWKHDHATHEWMLLETYKLGRMVEMCGVRYDIGY